ncbi:MAG: hypothetical protein ACI4NJ_08335 [Cellvibrio sp.]
MKERIVRRTKEELKKIKGKTDHVYVGNTSDKEIERQVENDPDSYIPTEEELKRFKPVKRDEENE